MSLFSRHRSYTEKVLKARKRRGTAGRVLALILIIAAVHSFLIRAYRISTDTMAPGLAKGDLVLASPLLGGISTVFGKLPPLVPLSRGCLVVVRPETARPDGPALKAWDSLVRFLSFQRISPIASRWGEELTRPGLYRVLGLPGDGIRRRGSGYEIDAGGTAGFLAEHLVTRKNYPISGQPRTASAIPAPEDRDILLAAGEYYVACDDRSGLDGSSLWGPIGLDRVEGRLILAFWPLNHLKFL
jgi:signal peptidase I